MQLEDPLSCNIQLDIRIFVRHRNILFAFGKVWQTAPCLTRMRGSGSHEICGEYDRAIASFAQSLPRVWSLLEYGLHLVSFTSSASPYSLKTILLAIERTCVMVSSHLDSHVKQFLIRLLQFFGAVEEEFWNCFGRELNISRLNTSPFISLKASFDIFKTLAIVLMSIGDMMVKSELFESIFEGLISPIDVFFTEVSKSPLSVDHQLELFGGNLCRLLSHVSKLRGLIGPIASLPAYLDKAPQLCRFSFSGLEVVSSLCKNSFSGHLIGANVIHVKSYGSSLPKSYTPYEALEMFHHKYVDLVCSVVESSSGLSDLELFSSLSSIIQKVQSSRLIDLCTHLIRWGFNADITPVANARVFQKAGLAAELIFVNCKAGIDHMLMNDICQLEGFDDLCVELDSCWRLCRQVCISAPYLWLQCMEGTNAFVISHFISLIMSSTKLILCDTATLEPAMNIKAIVSALDQLRVCCDSLTASFDDWEKLNLHPVLHEVLGDLLSHIIYCDDSSSKQLQLCFGYIFCMLLALHRCHEMVEMTPFVLESLFWPFCSRVFSSSHCQLRQNRISSLRGQCSESIDGGVFRWPRNAERDMFPQNLEQVSAEEATTMIAKTLLENMLPVPKSSMKLSKKITKSMSEIQSIFRIGG